MMELLLVGKLDEKWVQWKVGLKDLEMVDSMVV
jgi:hypothetical protein